MSERQEKHIKAWEAIRAKGKWNFILKWGVLGFGGMMFLLMGLALPYLMHWPNSLTAKTLAIQAVISLIDGLILGYLYWFVWDKRYDTRKHSARNIPQ